MKNLLRLAIVVLLIVATGGLVPVGAAPPTPVEVTVDVSLAATCNGGGLEATADVTIAPETATLIEFNINVAKIGTAAEPAYHPSMNQESWGFGAWGEPAASIGLPYTVDTTDTEWGVSWNGHGKVFGTVFVSTGFFDVFVSAGAGISKGKKPNQGNRSRAFDDKNWAVDCSTGTANITENPGLNWCWEDDWTHQQGFEGLVTFDETTGNYVNCPYG